MYKKTITYTDYNNVERTEDFWFNFSKAEIMEMEMSVDGGMSALMKKVASTQDAPSLVKIFKDLVLDAYGERSADGRRFMKHDDNGRRLSDNFKETEAYSVLFMELAFDDKAAAEFMNGIIPKDLAKQIAETKELSE